MTETTMDFSPSIDLEAQVRRDVEEKLRAREKELEDLVENAPVGLHWITANGAISWANSTALALFGGTREEVFGCRLVDFFAESEEAKALCNDIAQGKFVENQEARIKSKDGSLRTVLISSNAFKENGRFVHARCVIRDITDRKKAEEALVDLTQKLSAKTEELSKLSEALAAAKEAAEKANRAKTDFLANMSHEIRTPLGAILGFAELLQDGGHTPEERFECISAILRNGRHLHQLVNDILDLSKVEAGKLELNFCETLTLEVLKDIDLLHRPQAEAKGLSFRLVPVGKLPETIKTDPARVHQILINLIGNALKFTDKGSIEVRVKYRKAKSKLTGFLVFEISDTGCGITEGEAERVFEPFIQADNSTARRYGGTGLGLSLARKLARSLGGNVRLLESRPGQGSTFSLRVSTGPVSGVSLVSLPSPLTKPDNETSPASNARSVAPRLRVLLFEDVQDNFRLLSYFLCPNGIELDWAENAFLGLKKADEKEYDVVLMDIQMPGMDGYEATRRLREKGYRGPIIALTGHAMKEERARCLAAGCDAHLTKPIDREKLLETIRRLSPKKKPEAPPTDERIRRYIDCDAETLSIIKSFIDEKLPKHLQALDLAIESGHWSEVGNMAHKLKGSIGVYADENLGSLAARIEEEASPGRQNPQEARDLLARIKGLNLTASGISARTWP